MALKRKMKRSESRCRFEFPEAYFKITKIETQANGKLRVQIMGYADESARKYDGNSVQSPSPMSHENQSFVYQKDYEIPESELETPTETIDNPTPSNVLKASVYGWLKKHVDFDKGTIDC